MAAQFTIPEIIEIAKCSQYLADDAASKGNLFGAKLDPYLGVKIYTIRQDVSDLYDLDPNNTNGVCDLIAMGNYLYGMCGMYALTAQAIIAGGGGSVVPPINPNQYIWYSFVGTVGSDQDDSSTYYNSIFIGALELNTMTVNSGALQTDPTNFTFDPVTGVIDWGSNKFFDGDIIAAQFYRKL
jgi:hypothetical protein